MMYLLNSHSMKAQLIVLIGSCCCRDVLITLFFFGGMLMVEPDRKTPIFSVCLPAFRLRPFLKDSRKKQAIL